MIALVEKAAGSAAVGIQAGPFKFLDHFTGSEEDRRRFGGRDREIHDIVTRVTNERTLVLFGPSGVGKTSLLLAGVFPALEERGVRPVHVRTLVSPLADLCRALDGDGGGPGLREAVARATADGPVVVVLDQLEELFLRFEDQPEERVALGEALTSVIRDPSLPLTVVFSLRMEFLGRLDELASCLPDLLTHRYPLQPLTPFGVRQAVMRPLMDAGIDFEPAVVSRLVQELGKAGGEPVLLQLLCTETYKRAARRADGDPVRLGAADVPELEGRRGVFFGFLNEVAEALPPEQRFLARLILDALVTDEGTKRAVRLQDLPKAGFTATVEEALAISGLLVSQRVLRRERKESREDWYELIHDQLVPTLREWLEGDGEFSRFRQARAFVRNNAASGVWRKAPGALGSLETLLAAPHERFRFETQELEMVVRNAIFHQSGLLAFWAGCYGADQTRALLLGMLNSGEEAERQAAAVSARLLTDEEGTLAGACRLAALRDASPAVRQKAARSLARLFREEDLQALRLAWKDRELRPRVWEVYAILHGQGHRLAGIPWHHRLRARHLHAKRVRAQALRPALSRAWTGAVTGALAGALWCLSHFGLAEAVRWVREPETYLSRLQSPWSLALLGLLGAGLGLLLGGLLAFAAAWEGALRGEGRWLAAITWRRPYVLLAWLLVSISLYGAVVAGGEGGSVLREPRAVAEGLAVALACLLPLLVARGCQACVWPGVSRAGIWLAGGVASSGWPVLLLLMAVLGARRSLPGLLAGRVVLCGILVSGLSLIAILSLAVSSGSHLFGPVPPVREGPRSVLRLLAVGALAVVPAVFISRYGTYRYLPSIETFQPEHGKFLKWENKELNPADPPVFEVKVSESHLETLKFHLEPAEDESDCQGQSGLPKASGNLKRLFLKPPHGGESPKTAGWCVVASKE